MRPCPAIAEGVVVQHLQQPLQVLQPPRADGCPCRAARSECISMHASEGPPGQQAARQQRPDPPCTLPSEGDDAASSKQQLHGLVVWRPGTD